MSIFGTAKSIIKITDWFIGVYENTTKRFKEWNRRRITRSIRRAIDSGDTSTISKRLRSIIQRRKKRRDSD